MRTLLTTLLILTSLCSFGKNIYDFYEFDGKYQQFDKQMNEVRFPSSDIQKVESWINDLEELCNKYPEYPGKASAYYFIGSYSFELKDYARAQKYLNEAKRLQPQLANKTPLNKYLSQSQKEIRQLKIVNSAMMVIIIWTVVIFAITIYGAKEKRFKKEMLIACAVGIVCGLALITAWFAIDTSSSADGMEKFYLTPALIKSTILDNESIPLNALLIYGFVTIIITGLASLASTVLPRYRLLFPTFTAILIGTCASTIYYQKNCQNTNRTGTGIWKRISFPETPILWHHEVPDEMIKMYDSDMQAMINDEKEKHKRLAK